MVATLLISPLPFTLRTESSGTCVHRSPTSRVSVIRSIRKEMGWLDTFCDLFTIINTISHLHGDVPVANIQALLEVAREKIV